MRCPAKRKKNPAYRKLSIFAELCWLLTWWKQQQQQLKCWGGEAPGRSSLLPSANGFLQQGEIKLSYMLHLFVSKNRQKQYCSELHFGWLSQVLILSSNIISVVCSNTLILYVKRGSQPWHSQKKENAIWKIVGLGANTITGCWDWNWSESLWITPRCGLGQIPSVVPGPYSDPMW